MYTLCYKLDWVFLMSLFLFVSSFVLFLRFGMED